MRLVPAAYAPLIVNYDAERQRQAEEEALWLQSRALKAIEDRLTHKMNDIDLGSAPKAVRLRAFARAQAETERRLVGELFDATVAELLTDGEIGEATDRRWTALTHPDRVAELWPDVQLQAAE